MKSDLLFQVLLDTAEYSLKKLKKQKQIVELRIRIVNSSVGCGEIDSKHHIDLGIAAKEIVESWLRGIVFDFDSMQDENAWRFHARIRERIFFCIASQQLLKGDSDFAHENVLATAFSVIAFYFNTASEITLAKFSRCYSESIPDRVQGIFHGFRFMGKNICLIVVR